MSTLTVRVDASATSMPPKPAHGPIGLDTRCSWQLSARCHMESHVAAWAYIDDDDDFFIESHVDLTVTRGTNAGTASGDAMV